MSKKPIIGITLDFVEDNNKYSYSNLPWYALRKNYADSVLKAGGIPIMIPYQIDTIDAILELIDGLIIPGSDADINPKFYQQDILSKNVSSQKDDSKTNFEMALLQKALEKNIHFLGICHGMQLLNVLLGGTLIQHIPDRIASDINHQKSGNKDQPSHLVDIKPHTILSSIYKSSTIQVNSNHHQAIDQLSAKLSLSAVAPDGVVEAIEVRGLSSALGVQWHPEHLNDNGDIALFEWLVRAAIG